jgi:glycerophosphoryl diester phosphodiesterase
VSSAWLTERPIAHRGLHTPGRPENSLGAVTDAVEAGYAVELDVRLTADGVPVVFHDERLDRLTDERGLVRDTTWETLSACTLLDTAHSVPRFDEVLDVVDEQVPLLVELKQTDRVGSLATAVASRLDRYGGGFAVQSFDPRLVGWFRRHRPDWPRGQLAGLDTGGSVVSRFAVNRLLTNLYTRPDFVGYCHEHLPYPPVARTRERGRPVLAWTVTTETARRTVDLFADNIIFEDIRP